MKITRIKKIENIGGFASFNSGGSIPIGDNKLAVIYGENTVGKTTFVDILRSANENSPSYIQDRVSLPNGVQEKQLVELNFFEDKQQNVNYKDNSWGKAPLKDKLYIFDQTFIQDNIFEGFHQTKDNRANFTNLILGKTGVDQSKTIEQQKIELSKYSARLKDSEPSFVRGRCERDILDYCNLQISDSDEDISRKTEKIEKDINKLQKVSLFKSIQKPEKISSISKTVASCCANIENIANTKLDNIPLGAVIELSEELTAQNKTDWVEHGIDHIRDNTCPFCEQSLKNVKERMDAILSLFGADYKKHKETVLQMEKDAASAIKEIRDQNLSNEIRKGIELLHKYDDYIIWPEDLYDNLGSHLKQADNLEKVSKQTLADIEKSANAFFEEKNARIASAIDLPSLASLREIESSFSPIITGYNKEIAKAMKLISDSEKAIAGLNDASIAEQLSKMRASKAILERNASRKAEDAQCKSYLQLINKRETLRNSIKEAEKDLEEQQSLFLKEKFETINDWFKKFGSKDFELSYKTSHRGNRPACGLTVKYRNRDIAPEGFKTVFSESDRRNLAISVFLACADEKDRILVFDDPVVSFDDNRILTTIGVLNDLTNQYPQIIITTHYKPFIVWLVKRSLDFDYLNIVSYSDGSRFIQGNCDNIASSEYEQLFEKLHDFVHGEKDAKCSLTDCRKFLENHINIWYQPFIRNRKEQLNDKILHLKENGVISEQLYKKYDGYRKSFNPDAHQTGEPTITELKTMTSDLLENLYGKSF